MRALAVAPKADATTQGWLLLEVGNYWVYRKKLSTARTCLLHSLELAEHTGDRRLAARAATSIASASADRREAAITLERYLTDLRRDSDPQTFVVALTTLASNYIDLGRLTEARKTLEADWQGVQKLNARERARPTLLLGLVTFLCGAHDRGRQRIDESCSLERAGPLHPGRRLGVLATTPQILAFALRVCDPEAVGSSAVSKAGLNPALGITVASSRSTMSFRSACGPAATCGTCCRSTRGSTARSPTSCRRRGCCSRADRS